MKNIVVTGATGFIGINLIRYLLNDKENHVFAIIRPSSSKSSLLPVTSNLSIVECSLDKISSLSNLLKEKIDIFYHLAWEGVRNFEREDRLLQQSNYENSIRAINVASELGTKVFIGTGSQAEYGVCTGKISESYPTNPVSEYGKAKLQVSQNGETLADKLGMKFIWVRLFSIYGTGDYEETLIISVLNKMINNESVLLTKCIQKWDYVYISDLVRALVLLTTAPSGVYNISSGTSRELKEYIYDMIQVTRTRSEMQFGAIPYGSEGIGGFDPVSEKLQKTTGWYPEVSFNQGICEIVSGLK